MIDTIKNPADDDIKLASALSEVVWRFHVYGAYGKTQSKAVKALSKRVTGYPPEVYKELFELSLKVLLTTIEAVEKSPKSPKPGQQFAGYADVDVEYVMHRLRAKHPTQTDEFLSSHIGAAISWFYMR